MFISTMSESIICTSVWSSVIFFYCFLVRPEGIKNTEELVDGNRFDPFSFIVSILPKSIICTSVWSSVIFFMVFWFAQKGLRIQKNLSTGIGSTPSRSSCLYCPSLSSLVVCGRWLFCIVFRFARREQRSHKDLSAKFVLTSSCSSLLCPNLSSLLLCGRV